MLIKDFVNLTQLKPVVMSFWQIFERVAHHRFGLAQQTVTLNLFQGLTK